MSNIFRRLRGALGMGLVWALFWGIVGGVIMEGIVDRDGKILDMWPQTLAVPGFVAGVLFSTLLSATSRRGRIEQLSSLRFVSLGALSGLCVGSIAASTRIAVVAGHPWLRVAAIVGSATLLSAAAARVLVALARKAPQSAPGELPGGASENDLPARQKEGRRS